MPKRPAVTQARLRRSDGLSEAHGRHRVERVMRLKELKATLPPDAWMAYLMQSVTALTATAQPLTASAQPLTASAQASTSGTEKRTQQHHGV
jgi:hypothetical protein